MANPNDQRWMARAIGLAEQGRGQTTPNPMVGAVIVKDGEVLAEGFHAQAGADHAEAAALRKVGGQAHGAELFVTLEPCCHYGKTPPCTEAIKAAGIRRVVAAVGDPNPKVAGGGFRQLLDAGVEVEVGVMAKEAWQQNAAFMTRILKQRPLVVWKAAASLDGRIAMASGESQWITGEKAREDGHRLRYQLDAIVVGSGTILADNPRLTARPLPPGKAQPLRVVMDRRAQVPPMSRVFHERSGPVWWLTEESPKIPRDWPSHCRHVQAPIGTLTPHWVLVQLYEYGLSSVLLEGGGQLAAAFWRAGLVDQVQWYLAPRLLGAKGRPVLGDLLVPDLASTPKLTDVKWKTIGDDLLLQAWGPDRDWLTEERFWRGGEECLRELSRPSVR